MAKIFNEKPPVTKRVINCYPKLLGPYWCHVWTILGPYFCFSCGIFASSCLIILSFTELPCRTPIIFSFYAWDHIGVMFRPQNGHFLTSFAVSLQTLAWKCSNFHWNFCMANKRVLWNFGWLGPYLGKIKAMFFHTYASTCLKLLNFSQNSLAEPPENNHEMLHNLEKLAILLPY